MKIDALKMAVLAPFAGKDVVLTGKEIAALCIQAQPDVNIGSLNIADSVRSPRQSQQYASYILAKVSGGYKVLPRNEWQLKPEGTRGTSKQTLGDAVVSVAAKVAALRQASEANGAQNGSNESDGPSDEPTESELEALTAPTN